MKNILLLDCTLRDGGYVNDWNFGHNTLVNVFERTVSAGIDFIEIGFLDQRRPFDINRSIMPDTDAVFQIYGNLDRKKSKVMGMIDFGTCELSHIKPRNQCFLDGIRLIFKKNIMHEALAFAKELKDLGYQVFTQLVSITAYTDEELMELIELENKVKPFAVSIVDTYGLLHKGKLFHYYQLLDTYLDSDIAIGYHSHNNFQLAYANCIELANYYMTNNHSDRTLLLDGTLLGMGKSAGNAPIELLTMYMNEFYHKQYEISQILEAIDCNILDIFKRTPWGYTMKFFISASNDCHPNYVTYLLDKKTLSIKSINEILQKLEGDAKLLYDKNYIEKLYIDYQKKDCNDTDDYHLLSEQFKNKKILIIGPGTSIHEEADKIQQFIAQEQPVVIAINFIPDICKINYLFLTNSKRYVQHATQISQIGESIKIIATSNVTKSNGNFDYNLDYESLIDRSAVFMDNSFIMLLKIMIKIGVKEVSLAGFDGYSSSKESDYYSSKMEYDFAKQKGAEINANVNKMLKIFKDKINLHFVTTTEYEHQ